MKGTVSPGLALNALIAWGLRPFARWGLHCTDELSA